MQTNSSFLHRILSFILHPLWMLSYVLSIILLFCDTVVLANTEGKIAVLISVFITSAIFPSIAIYVLYRWQIISSVYLQNREERLLPLIITILSYLFLAYTYIKITVSPLLVSIISATAFTLTVATMITFSHKISLHALGSSGVLAILLWVQLHTECDLLWSFVFFLLICGIAMHSRLAINAHQPKEVFNGFATGFLLTFGYLFFV